MQPALIPIESPLLSTRIGASPITNAAETKQNKLEIKSTNHTAQEDIHNILRGNPIQGEKPQFEIKHY